ncbi:MAG: BTAD domain-containing putative transcriptional regulator [Pseudomonadota bacterium]
MPTGATAELLAFLAHQRDLPIRRDAVIDALWPESAESRARSSLNTAVWRCRKLLAKLKIRGVRLDAGPRTVSLKISPALTVDTHRLISIVQEVSGPAGQGDLLSDHLHAVLAAVLDASAEPFLDEFDSHWVIVEREKLVHFYVRGLSILLCDHCARRNYEEALQCGRRILELDPLLEGTQRQMMWLHVLNGNRSRAIRRYEECASLLRRELQIEPMPETTALYDYILQESGAPRHDLAPEFLAPDARQTSGDRLLHTLSRLEDHRQAIFARLSHTPT